jgi:hypothetical protein
VQAAVKHFDAFTEVECIDMACDSDHDVANCTVEHEAVNLVTPSSLEQMVGDFEKNVNECILKLREKHVLTSAVQQDIVDEMQQIISQIHDAYTAMFKTFCHERQLSADDAVSGMRQFLCSSTSMYSDVLENMDSDYKLRKFISANFVHVKPVEMLLAHRAWRQISEV